MSGFMVDLAMGYYNENSTMVGGSSVKVDFSDCGPYLYASVLGWIRCQLSFHLL